MRQFGNESDGNGNADGEFDAAINSRSFNLVDAADIVAAADVTRSWRPFGFSGKRRARYRRSERSPSTSAIDCRLVANVSAFCVIARWI